MEGKDIVFFDGVCNLCNRSVQTILKYDRKNRFRFASLQGETAGEMLSAYLKDHPESDSILLMTGNTIFSKSTAVLRIARYLAFPLNLSFTFIIIPVFIRDAVYKWIAANRYRWFGKRAECWLPSDEYKLKFLP